MNPQGWKDSVCGRWWWRGKGGGGTARGDQRCEMLKTTAEYNTGLAVVSLRGKRSRARKVHARLSQTPSLQADTSLFSATLLIVREKTLPLGCRSLSIRLSVFRRFHPVFPLFNPLSFHHHHHPFLCMRGERGGGGRGGGVH